MLVRARLVIGKGVMGWMPFPVGLLVVGVLLFGSYPGSAECKLMEEQSQGTPDFYSQGSEFPKEKYSTLGYILVERMWCLSKLLLP